VANAVDIATSCSRKGGGNSHQLSGDPYKVPFGIWYRGHALSSWNLKPSAFRVDDKLGCFDETSIYHHFQLRSPGFKQSHQTPFDWLCLMQHYRAPTRLLDWTESILVALYFAVANSKYDGEDALLFVLDAEQLNTLSYTERVTSGNADIYIPDSFNVVLRSLMTVYREPVEWFASGSLDVCDETDTPPRDLLEELRRVFYPKYNKSKREPPINKFLDQIRKPVAVYPFRDNPRLQAQTGTFTIHGGKVAPGAECDAHLSIPTYFEDLAAPGLNSPITVYMVPREAKATLKKELKAIGIHGASLFPELDYQSEYMKDIWRLGAQS
jgi:hypothetical protein